MYFRFSILFFCLTLCNAGVGSPIDSLHRKATHLYANGYYADAYFIFKKNLTIQEHQQQPDEEFLARTHRNIGMCLVELNQIKKAEKYLSEAIENYKQIIQRNKENSNNKTNVNRLGVSYQHRARVMRRKGDFKKAIDDANQALVQFQIVDKINNIIRINNVLANIYIDIQEYEKAKNLCEKTIAKYQSTDVNRSALADMYHTLAIANISQAKYEQAIKDYDEALKFTENPVDFARTYSSIGLTYIQMGDLINSEKYLAKGLKKKQELNDNSPYHFSYSSTYENFGDLKVAQNDLNTALNYYQLSLVNLTDNFRNQDPNANPTITGNHHIYNKSYLLQLLDLKAQAALKSGNTDLAYDTYQVLDEWINEFYKDLSTNESKLTWIARTHDMYTHAIDVALKKDDQAKAFEYAEKARAVLLWQSHSQQAALSLLDNEERENYDNLLAQIRQVDYEYRDAVDENKAQVKNTLDSLNREFNQFEKTLSDTNPEYAQRKYQPKTITLNDVQTNILNDTTALIEYHWSADDILYIFTLTKNEIYVDAIQVNDAFHKNIQAFYTTLKDYKSDIVESGYPIYQTIFESMRGYLNENVKKIILLPDGKLNYIPFEALPTNRTDDVFDIPYLINDYTFNYLYSCSSYRNLPVANTIQTALYIAPEYGEKDDLPYLKSTQIAKKFKDLNLKLTSLTGGQSTRQRVVDAILKADIIHFHAHAEQGKKGTGKIHLYANDELTQAEIQELLLNKPPLHVVLSACETGTGELSKGEGVLSLGWSFVYRGVPSVVMSLWKVDDSSTSELMKNYYEHLNKGMSGDEALQKAKLELISNGGDEYKHPYHWAAFIHTGNPPTKQFNPNTRKYFFILGGFLLLFFIVYLIRKR